MRAAETAHARLARLRRVIPGVSALQAAVEARLLWAALALPERVQRVLAGDSVVRDGLTLATDTQLMLRLMELSPDPSPATVPVERGRRLVSKQTAMVAGEQRVGAVERVLVDGATGVLPARLYVPTDAAPVSPLLVYFHGGGWIFGSVDDFDGVCRRLAERSGVRVLSVDYRLAPEHPFPAAYDDAVAATLWALDHAADLGADPAHVGVGGDSAGGALAAGAAIAVARAGRSLAGQLLVYPGTDHSRETRSRELFDDRFYLTRAFLDLARDTYLPVQADRRDPRASVLLDDALPANLAPAYVATAGFDPLRDEGEAYVGRLADAGVPVELRRFEDQIHGFLNVIGVGRSARACVDEIADALSGLLL